MTESSAAAAGAKARFQQINPHFVVRDVVEAAEYYRDVLGFKILGYYWDPPVFAMVGRDDALDAYIWVDHLDALYAELKDKGAKIVEEPKRHPWNCYEFSVEDAFGFRIVFSESTSAG